MDALRQIDTWGAGRAAAGVVRAEGVVATHGATAGPYRWASITKPATALATLVAAEEGILDLDEPAGPPGSTVRHLLAHASGLAFEAGAPIGRPGARRMYSNHGFLVLGDHVGMRAGMPFADYLRAAVLEPLGLGCTFDGHPGAGLSGTLDDLLAFGREWLAPTLVSPETFAEATSVQFPGLDGVIPGVGRFSPNDWGLGFELKDGKPGHWTGTRTSPRTFGHIGGSGTFLWADPEVGLALGCLTDRGFDAWALEAWPALSDAVLAEAAV